MRAAGGGRQFATVAVLLGLAVLAVGVVAFSGTVGAQVSGNGTVDLEDPIYADQTDFDVTVTSLNTDSGEGCLNLYRNGGAVSEGITVEEGDTLTFTEQDVGAIENDDEFAAELGSTSLCDGSFDSDTTVVSQAGGIRFDDSIYADDTEFDVSVTSLRADDGCLGLQNDGEIVVDSVSVEEGETVTFSESQVGGIENGTNFTARLGGVDCEESLATASRVVTNRGRVDLDDTIVEGQTSFEVTVTDLRIDDDAGCVVVENSGGRSVNVTGVVEDETRTVSESYVGHLNSGDKVTATLVAHHACDGSTLDSDSTIVSEGPTPTDEPESTPTPTAASTATPEATATLTPSGNGGADTPTASEGDGSDARFDVTIESVQLPDGTVGLIEVDATVENTGSGSGTQRLTLRANDETLDTKSVSLDAGESRTVTFAADSPDTVPETVEVSSESDIEMTTVDGDDDGSFADGPGFGVGAGLVGLAGAWSLLRRLRTGSTRR